MPGVKTTVRDRDATGPYTVYTLSQSWLNTLQNCPEQARRELVGDIDYSDTDATVIGSAVHQYIETYFRGDSNHAFEDAIEYVDAHWEHCTKVKVKTKETAIKRVGQFINEWMIYVLPALDTPMFVEYSFKLDVYATADYRIEVAGTVDFVDKNGVWDWKTTSSRIRDRYGDREVGKKIQPVPYLKATGCDYFHYAVLSTRESPAIITTTRDNGHWDWFVQRCRSAVTMIRADLPVWPYNDSTPLCSSNWCPVYDSCKGAYCE